MFAYAVTDHFGLDNLKRVERPTPDVSPGHVLVRMRAASLNYRDLLMVKGLYNPRQPLPLVPLSDGAGDVIAVGDGVSTVRVGDKVTTLFSQKHQGGRPTRRTIGATLGGPIDGALQEIMLLPENGIVPAPAYMSHNQASTLPCAGVTAWSALAVQGELEPGDTVLTIGTGGVSVFALQIAKAMGMKVIVTSRSAAKLERARALGADHVIDTSKEPDWGKAARAFTADGVDQVIEVGGVGTLDQSIRAVRPGGQISLIGVLAGNEKALNLTPVLMQNIRIQGVFVGSRPNALGFSRFCEEHALAPVIDKIYPVAEHVHEAFAAMERGDHFGKIVLTF
jgi:NADPH:quinone reductase-like Zn-dependent oxidoreductase